MTKTMIGMRIFEMTETGLEEVIQIETEPLTDPKDQKEALEVMTDMVFKNDSLYVVFQDQALVMRGLKTKTVVIKAVFNIEHGKETK